MMVVETTPGLTYWYYISVFLTCQHLPQYQAKCKWFQTCTQWYCL